MIPLAKVYSMVAVQTSHVLLGTDSGLVLVYDGYSQKRSHQFSPLHNPVLCLQFFKCVACVLACVRVRACVCVCVCVCVLELQQYMICV